MTDWHTRPLALIPLGLIVFPCHDLDPHHVHPHDDRPLTSGPIHVEQLLDGHYYVHDGRHRTLRAIHNGHQHIWARIA